MNPPFIAIELYTQNDIDVRACGYIQIVGFFFLSTLKFKSVWDVTSYSGCYATSTENSSYATFLCRLQKSC